MIKNRKNTISILIDIRYKFSMNKFEEEFGENVHYSSIEQSSYIDLKEMVFEKINKNIKFRKFARENNVLTLKVEMTDKEYEKFISLNKDGNFKFIHDFVVSDIRLFTDLPIEEEK
jgi:hypothetical protein